MRRSAHTHTHHALVHISPPPSLAPWRPYLRAPIPETWQTLTLAPSADTVHLCILSRTTPITDYAQGVSPARAPPDPDFGLLLLPLLARARAQARARVPAHAHCLLMSAVCVPTIQLCFITDRRAPSRAESRGKAADGGEPFLHYTVHHPPYSDPLPLLPSLPPRARAPETGDPIALSLALEFSISRMLSACGFRPSPCPCQSVLYDRHRRCNLAP